MKRASIFLVFAFLLHGCASIVRERLYHPEPLHQPAPPWPGTPPREVTTTTSDGLQLKGFFWPPAQAGGRLIIFFHGNAGNRLTAAHRAAPLAAGDGLLVASYRGYGDNPGEPTEQGLIRDGLAFLQLARRLTPTSRIYLFGWSLGGAVALELAAREEVAGVVTLGAFTAIADLAPGILRPFITDRFDNLRTIRRVEEPILIVHGTADEIVPFAHAERLRAAAPGPARLLPLTGAGHHPDFARLAPIILEAIGQMQD